jgi:hypothetical protein
MIVTFKQYMRPYASFLCFVETVKQYLSPDVVPGSLGLRALEIDAENTIDNETDSLHEARHA